MKLNVIVALLGSASALKVASSNGPLPPVTSTGAPIGSPCPHGPTEPPTCPPNF